MTCCVRRATSTACSVGSAHASSKELVCRDWVPPSTPARASMAVLTMLFSGCCHVSDAPEVWVWNLMSRLRLSFTPYFSRRTVAHILLAALNFAISSKKSIVELKKKLRRGANCSTFSPASSPSST